MFLEPGTMIYTPVRMICSMFVCHLNFKNHLVTFLFVELGLNYSNNIAYTRYCCTSRGQFGKRSRQKIFRCHWSGLNVGCNWYLKHAKYITGGWHLVLDIIRIMSVSHEGYYLYGITMWRTNTSLWNYVCFAFQIIDSVIPCASEVWTKAAVTFVKHERYYLAYLTTQ